MKNTGSSCSNWRHYAPSPPPPNSNLSAFAAPFSVNPYAPGGDVSPHFMDSAVDAAETLPVPLPLPLPSNHFQSYGYNFFSSPNREIDSSSRFSLVGVGAYGESIVEGQPHHPSYSAINDHSSSSSVPLPSYHWPSSSLDWPTLAETHKSPPELGLSAQNAVSWEQSPEFNNIRVWSTLPRKEYFASDVEESMNQGHGDQDVKDYVESEVSHMINWEKHSVPPSGNHLHDATSSSWGTIKPMPVELPGARVMQYPLVSLENPEAPLNSMNNHLSKTGSYDKPSRDDNVSGTDLNIENILADEHLGNNNFCNTKDAFHLPNPGTAGSCFDSGHLRMQLPQDASSSSNNNASRDVMFRGYGFQNRQPNMDNLSLRLSTTEDSANEDLNFVEKKSFDNSDLSNLAEDSPCWKGASATNFSMFGPSVHYVHSDGFGPSVMQEPHTAEDKLKKLCEKLNSAKKFKIVSKDSKSGGAVNDGPFQSKPNDFGLQFVDPFKMMKRNVTPVKSESSCTKVIFVEENKLTKQCTDDADLTKNLESSITHVKEPALSSPPSIVVDTTTPETSAGKVSPERLNVQMLVDTTQNLSELLLNHSLNDACALRERDCNILRNVISNLNKCLLNQIETSNRPAGESNDIQLNASLKKTQLTKIGPASSKVEFQNPLIAEENLHFTKADHMTKDIKRILVENFHDDDDGAEPQTLLYKNLWLEAEAALCSAYYRARYNRMKIEMDKYSCKGKEMEKLSKSEVVPTLSQSQSSAAEMHSDPDSPAPKLPVLDATKPEELSRLNLFTGMKNAPKLSVLDATSLEELSRLKLFIDMKKPNTMTAEGKCGQNLDSFINNYAPCCSDKEAERIDEPSIMARYQVLKARVDHSSSDSTNQEESLEIADKSASGGMDDQNQVDLWLDSPISENNSTAPKGMDNQNQVDLCLGSPISENNTDYAASVVARFHILKSRIEGSSSISSERPLVDGVGFPGKGIDDTTIAKSIERPLVDGVGFPGKGIDDTTIAKSIPKFHQDLEDSQEIHPWEFQIQSCHSDGLASDWEHVEKSL